MADSEEKMQFSERVSRAVICAYDNLKKTGKPQQGREWTLLAGFVKTDEIDGEPEVVSLATGSKCIGKGKRQPDGSIVNDSHAEILARRLLLKYFMGQIQNADCNFQSIFTKSSKEGLCSFKLKPNVKFHLYTSQTPCGDCSIFPNDDYQISNHPSASVNDISSGSKRRNDSGDLEEEVGYIKRCRKEDNIAEEIIKQGNIQNESISFDELIPRSNSCINSEISFRISKKNIDTDDSTSNGRSKHQKFKDIQRTGAKCVPLGMQDPHLEGADYHVVGVLRTKPGRGERTLSMSCSDKIMKWCAIGLQGGLLSNLLDEPIYLQSIIVGNCPFDLNAMQRGISLRGRELDFGPTCSYRHTMPLIYHCDKIEFLQSRRVVEGKWRPEDGHGRPAPCGSSVLFCKEPAIHEVIVNGRKQGVTKKHEHKLEFRSSVSKASLFHDFNCLISKLKNNENDIGELEAKNYRDLKCSNKDYVFSRGKFFQCFSDWITKPLEDEKFV